MSTRPNQPHPPASGTPRRAVLAILALTVLGGAGCATKGDLRTVSNDIRSLSARQDSVLAELQRQSRLTADTLRTQSDRLVDLRGNVSQALRQILQELETLKELAGQNQRTIASMRDQLVALQGSLRTGAPQQLGGAVGMERSTDETPEALYSAAMIPFNRGSVRAAELGFQRFISQYPDHELTPLAHFNLADTYAQDGRFREAVAEFEKIPERFPTSDRVPQALYRIGLIHLNDLDNRQEGRRYLERVINTYPDSAVADLARRALAGSGGGDG